MLNIATRAARRAGTVITRSMQRLHEVQIDRKGHHDYVTQTDRDAEDAIIGTLREAYPDHAILAEESGASGSSEYEWVIDPLDGTLNFLHDYPQVGISIALKVRGRLDQAVVYDPLRDEMYTASRGAGAQMNGHRIRVSNCEHLANALLATGFAVREADTLEACLPLFGAVLRQCADVRRAGAAALDLAHVAAGRLDGYWEFGLREWDVAAGSLLVQESGGLAGDPAGGETQLESGNIVAANPRVFRQLLAALSKAGRGLSAAAGRARA